MLNELPSLDEQRHDQSHPPPHVPVGLVVLSSSLHLLYQNQHAQSMYKLIKGEEFESLSPLTTAFQELGKELLVGLRHPSRLPSAQPLEKKWVVVLDAFTIRCQGIGIGHHQNVSEHRILIRFSIRKDGSNG